MHSIDVKKITQIQLEKVTRTLKSFYINISPNTLKKNQQEVQLIMKHQYFNLLGCHSR
jgi:hypothetical protein